MSAIKNRKQHEVKEELKHLYALRTNLKANFKVSFMTEAQIKESITMQSEVTKRIYELENGSNKKNTMDI